MTSNNPDNSHHKIDAAGLNNRLQSGEKPVLLDVREVIEYHTFNIGGINIPLSKLAERINELDKYKQQEIIVVCKIGLRSETAVNILTENGFNFARNLSGGLMALRRLT